MATVPNPDGATVLVLPDEFNTVTVVRYSPEDTGYAFYGINDNDTLIGGTDRDYFELSAGTDLIDGGDGAFDGIRAPQILDTWEEDVGSTFASVFATGLMVDLQLQTYSVDWRQSLGDLVPLFSSSGTVMNIEWMSDSRGDDTFLGSDHTPEAEDGSAVGELFLVAEGIDFVDGRGGVDVLGIGSFTFGTVVLPGVVVDVSAGTLLNLDGLVDRFENIERFRLSYLDDTFLGGVGNDWVIGSAGDDTLTGGDGRDVLDYSGFSSSGPVQLNVQIGMATTPGWTDRFSGFETYHGTQRGDEMRGHDDADTFLGHDGDDRLFGFGSDDLLLGGTGEDELRGGAGVDTIHGGDDNDRIYGDADSDVLLGGDGDDEIHGGAAADVLSGEDGADRLYGEDGDDEITGGAQNDLLVGGAGNDLLTGGPGSDVMSGNAGQDEMVGGLHDDNMSGGADDDTILGGAGNDTLRGDGGADLLRGDDDDDRLFGGDGNDILDGGTGNDLLSGGAGNDAFYPNAGNDTIQGGSGEDDILALDLAVIEAGGAVIVDLRGGFMTAPNWGRDSVSGVEDVYGTTAGDTIIGDGADNALIGQGGGDIIRGWAGDDEIRGGGEGSSGNATDILRGDAGADVIGGFGGNDQLFGGADNDILSGGTGNDIISGGLGLDILFGGADNDTLIGGAGADFFRFSSGQDRILDFDPTEDKVLLPRNSGFGSIGEAVDAARGVGAGVLLPSNVGSFLFRGMDVEDVTTDLFVFLG